MLNFRKGRIEAFEKLSKDASWNDRAQIIQQQMAGVLDAQNLTFLLGAGCSSLMEDGEELGIPTMGLLAKKFKESYLNSDETKKISNRLGLDLAGVAGTQNLEQMMTVLINAYQFFESSTSKNSKISAADVYKIIVETEKFILEQCTPDPLSRATESVLAVYGKFYHSLATRPRGLPPPWVFTTNYDLFNERAMDRSGVPYCNGFVGTVERRFNPAAYRRALAEQLDITSRRWVTADGFVYFCKLHGSINWTEEPKGLFPIREVHSPLDPSDDRVMIYPTPSKQSSSLGSPYSDMFREFQRQIAQDQSVLVILGSSFGDEHVNNIIFQGLMIPSFRLIAFMDPETNNITRSLASLGDPRIWFIWGEDETTKTKAHYFDNVVKSLLPTGADQKIDEAIEKVSERLIAKNPDSWAGQYDEG